MTVLIAVMLFFAMKVAAQEQSVRIGYCDGEVSPKGLIASSGKNIWVEGAMFVPAKFLGNFAGNRIDSIYAGLSSKLNIDTLKVWVRSSPDGINLAEGTITKDSDNGIVKGWNKVGLDNPYVLSSENNSGLYIGYSFYQKNSSFGLSVVSEKAAPDAFYLKIGDNGWEDRSADGALSVDAVVRGDKLPQVNLALSNVQVKNTFIKDKGQLTLSGTVKNFAVRKITGFDADVRIDGTDDICTVHIDTVLSYRQSANFTITVNPEIKEILGDSCKGTLTISNINEGNDEDPDDNSIRFSFRTVDHDYTSNILVEEFTTELCSNCPRVAGYIHEALKNEDYVGRVFVVCHHSGYYTDWLTASCDNDYLWFYNSGGASYAPALMVDRHAYTETTPVFLPSSQAEMELYWNDRLEKEAFVSVNVNANVDNDRKTIHVNVNGSKSVDKLCDNPRLTVFLLENDIKAKSQAGADVSDYRHQHVTRAVNSVWGENITWNGNDYEYSCDFAKDDSWKGENMEIVAFISNYNENDPANCDVVNVGGLSLKEEFTTNVRNIEDGASLQEEFYTVSGQKITQTKLAPGVYIVKKGNNVHKIFVERRQ